MTPSDAVTVADIGIAEVATSALPAEHAARLAMVLDAPDELGSGDPLPFLWHWAFFTPSAPTASLRPDGHPADPGDGGRHPIAGLPRRMWAGGRVRSNRPLRAGRPATRRSSIRSAQRKSGLSGELLIVCVRHEIEQDGHTVLTEEQDLVYRPAADEPIPAPVGNFRAQAPAGGWAEPVRVDPVRLFRFSAVTFNSHRIHYDQPYTVGTERYPGLVVHGPLTALLLAESARRRGRAGSALNFRASVPLFADVAFTLVGQVDPDGIRLSAVRNDGRPAMTALLTSGEPGQEAGSVRDKGY